MRHILHSLIALLLITAPAAAQSSKATLNTEVSTNYPDNTTGAITPAILRTTTNDMIASWQQAPTVNAQTGASYAIVVGDYGKLVTFSNASPVAVTLPQATVSFSTFNVMVKNLGAGTVTITPTTSTIDGAASYILGSGASMQIISDGANYKTYPGLFSSTISPTLTGNWIFSPTAGTAVAIVAPAGNFTAFVVNQNSVSGGTGSAAQFSSINVTDLGYNGGALPATNALGVNMILNSSNIFGGRQALAGIVNLSAATNVANTLKQYVGVVGVGHAQANDGGTLGARVGAIFGSSFQGEVTSAGTHLVEASAGEINISVQTSAANAPDYVNIWSLVARNDHAAHGKVFDADLSISAQAGSVGMLNGILFCRCNGIAPLATTGTLIATSGADTVATGIDISSYTISGNAWNSTGATMTGAGAWTALSYTGPNVFGGTLAASTLSLVATSGAGVGSESVLIKAGNNGATTVLTAKTTGLTAGVGFFPGTGSFSANNGQVYTSIGVGGNGLVITAANSGASGTNDFGFFNIGGTALLNNPHNTTNIVIANGAATATGGGGLTIGAPTGGDKGAGTISAQSGFFANGTAGVSTTCTVTAGNTYVFTFGLLTTKGANCT